MSENKSIFPWGWISLFAFIASLYFFFFHPNPLEIKDGEVSEAIAGDTFFLDYKTNIESINGLSKVIFSYGRSLENSDTFDLEGASVSSLNGKCYNPKEPLQVNDLRLRGISIADYTDPVTLTVSIPIPEREAWYGQVHKFIVHASFIYPQLSQKDNTLERTLSDEITYRSKLSQVDIPLELKILPPGNELKSTMRTDIIGGIVFLLIFLYALLKFGENLPEEVKS